MVPNKGVNEYQFNAIATFMCGRGRAILKSFVEQPIVVFQESVKNAIQSGTFLGDSPKGDSQSNGAAWNTVSGAEKMQRTWKMIVDEQLKAVMNKRHVLFP